MRILGIETSCDETASAVVDINDDKIVIKSQVVGSQIEIHKQYGGVVPEVAARTHMQNVIPIVDEALAQAGTNINEIDLVAVTQGPGLMTSLMIGLEFGKTLSFSKTIPFVSVNHLAGHVFSWALPAVGESKKLDIKFPFLSLIISGGHTELVLVENFNKFKLIGRTLDDAVGEAFDKVAKMLELEYPGGPKISKLAEAGDETAFDLPRPMLYSDNFDFSFAGLKTAVLYKIRDLKELDDKAKQDMAASFQTAVTEVLLTKTFKAAEKYDVNTIAIVGGVSANSFIRDSFIRKADDKVNSEGREGALGQENIKIKLPDLAYTGDNGTMIALAGYLDYKNKKKSDNTEENYLELSADPNLRLV